MVAALEDGVALTGWEPESPLYKKRWKVPTMTEQQLRSSAVWRRRAMMGKPMTKDEKELAPQLWEETMKEKDLGFVEGPFSEQQISEKLGCDDWSASQRFLLLQGDDAKPRVIDNYKTSCVNNAFGSSSYLALHDTDFISCFLVYMIRCFTDSGTVNIELEDGSSP